MKTWHKPILLSAALGVAAVALLLSYWPHASPATADTSTVAGRRTVIVIVDGKPANSPQVKVRLCGASPQCRNGENGIDIVALKSGEMPKHATSAVVKTDTDCAPDPHGISHCTNRLLLSDGRILEVRHDHNMQQYPCLNPGETVEIRSEESR